MLETRWDGPGWDDPGWDDPGWDDPDRWVEEADLGVGPEDAALTSDPRTEAERQTSVWARWELVHATGRSDVAVAARIADLEALLTQLQAWQARELRTLRAMRLAEQEALHGPDPRPERVDPDGWLPSEVGFALGLSEGQVRARLAFGAGLEQFAQAGELIARGALPGWTAARLLDHLTDLSGLLPADRLAEVEAATVAWLQARPRTVGQLNARMKRLLVRARAEYDAAHPPADRPEVPSDGPDPSDAPDPCSDLSDPGLDAAVLARHADRRVEVRSLGDGCAELWALLPEADALAVRAALDTAAPRLVDLPADAGETRTRAQRRADVLVSALTGAPACYGRTDDVSADHPAGVGVGALIELSVPVATLTGGSLEPGHCPGYGPVHPLTCRDLAADVATRPGRAGRAVLYDPATGRLVGLAGQVDLGPIVWGRRPAGGRGIPAPTERCRCCPGAGPLVPGAGLPAPGPPLRHRPRDALAGRADLAGQRRGAVPVPPPAQDARPALEGRARPRPRPARRGRRADVDGPDRSGPKHRPARPPAGRPAVLRITPFASGPRGSVAGPWQGGELRCA